MIRLALFCSAILLTGCMTSRTAFSSKWDPLANAQYEDYVNYYLFGFIGQPELSLQRICVDQRPYGFERTRTIEDGLLFLFTLGIYTPATVRVWCGD